jgi:hypothetical protein
VHDLMAGKKELMAGVSHTIKPKNCQVQDRKPVNRRCEFEEKKPYQQR